MADTIEVFFMQIDVLILRLVLSLAVANEVVSDLKQKKCWGLSFHNYAVLLNWNCLNSLNCSSGCSN